MRTTWAAALGALLVAAGGAKALDDEKVFSGPQPGEKLTGFKVAGVYDDQEGKELDFVKESAGKPTMIVFVHELTRPSGALMRAATGYAETRKKDGLHCYIVWLHKDRTEATNYLKNARKSLGFKVPVGVSLDGAEGPGAYGLNRKVGMTILVARDNKVTANFALTQPAMKDIVAIAEAIVKQVGGKAPELKDLEAMAGIRPATPGARDPKLGELLRAVIQRTAKPEDVQKAKEEVEKYVGDDKAKQGQLGEIAKIASENKYGTEEAQKVMKGWAEKYGKK